MKVIPKLQDGNVIRRDNIRSYKPEVHERTKMKARQYSFTDLGGEPSPDMTTQQRLERQTKDRTWEDSKNLLRGLNNTFGRAASLASFAYGGGWAATRLLSGNKATKVGQVLSKYVLPTNTIDTVGDALQLIEDPSISNVAETGISLGLGKWRDFGKVSRQAAELGSQGLNFYNSYQDGGVLVSDNTRIYKPQVYKPIKVIPRQDQLIDLGGEPSKDKRSSSERNIDYWKTFKGAKSRFKASMENETNPLVGLERTALPAMAGAALVTTPATMIGGTIGGVAVDKATGGWGNWLEDKTGLPAEIGTYTNPGAIYGGVKGYKIDSNKLASKFIKGDADLAWNPINKEHWVFNKEARTPSNIALASANRLAPFLSRVEKLPMKAAAYQVAKRTQGNASTSIESMKAMDPTYKGSAIMGGSQVEGRDLLAKYIFGDSPLILNTFLKGATKNIKPISANEAKRSFSHGERYDKLYPGLNNRRYAMQSVVPQGNPLNFRNGMQEFIDYAGTNPIGKVVGKEGTPVMRIGDKEYMTFRDEGSNYVGPIDDVAGHVVKFQMDKGKLKQTSQDLWKFNPADYAKRWGSEKSSREAVRLTKQAGLMDKVGTPFILQQSNSIRVDGKPIRDPNLLSNLKLGGQFTFKKSSATKDAEQLNGKRDMRKKFIKSDRPTYKRRISKAQEGLKFAQYNQVNTPEVNYDFPTESIDNLFSDYNIPTQYNTESALVVPDATKPKEPSVNEDKKQETEKIAEKTTYTPKAYKGLAEFNKSYDAVEATNPEARKYRQFLTKMAEKESGFNSAIQNSAGAPAYGYFQFMQDDKKYNNIKQYAGTDVNTFRSNPKVQIEAAIKLAKSFEKGFRKEDLEIASKKGYSTWGLLGGAWLAGNGGVRKFLQGQGNPSDRHWSNKGNGTDVATRILDFNF